MSDDEFEEICQFFLLENWHHGHEDIIGKMQRFFNTNKNNITYLTKRLADLPEFYKYDEALKYPFVRKIIYAIGAQPEPYNFEALEIIAQSDDQEIRDLALHQIGKRRKLGRWEAERNLEEKN